MNTSWRNVHICHWKRTIKEAKQTLLINTSLVNSGTLTTIATPTIQIGGIIQTSHGSQGHNQQHTSSLGNALEQALLKLTSKVDDFVCEQKGINKQHSLRMDNMENSQNDMANKMDNMKNIISKFANSHTSQ